MLQNFMGLEPRTEFFSDIHFQALVLFPSIKILPEGRISIVSITFTEQLFSYNYLTILLVILSTGIINNKYQFYVQFEILQIMSTSSIQKKLHVESFLGQFKISNKKQTEIRQLIFESLQDLVEKQIIKSFFKTIQKDGSLKIYKNFTPELITKSKLIYLEEILYYKDSINELESHIFI